MKVSGRIRKTSCYISRVVGSVASRPSHRPYNLATRDPQQAWGQPRTRPQPSTQPAKACSQPTKNKIVHSTIGPKSVLSTVMAPNGQAIAPHPSATKINNYILEEVGML